MTQLTTLDAARAAISAGGSGIYDMPDDVYHADPAPTPSLSASGMKRIIGECPAAFWWDNRRLNPGWKEETTKALSVGRAAHMWLLQGAEFEQRIAVMPAELDLRSNAGKAFAAQAEGEGKTLIRAKEFEAVKAMRDAAMRSDLVRLALSNGRAEQSLFWQDAETGVWLRCRPDWLPTVPVHVPDFKTTTSAHPDDFRRAVQDYGYHIQAAHTLDGIEAVTGTRPDSFFFIVQEKAPPYLCSICTLDDEAMMWGERLARRAIRLFARCLETGHWPGYDGGISTVGLPAYALKTLEGLEALGFFDAPEQKDMSYERAAE
ncbi:PD-(D/E)XK nuclease-like domain-containing protein [Phaeospirillum tilakii]|uniref:PD-(D/E)XK nuclease-like domain-containing protein n=1 Tax=Phaeospirillum tilakii TaxID=741673 RepID=A0ABW5C6C5_9PROT